MSPWLIRRGLHNHTHNLLEYCTGRHISIASHARVLLFDVKAGYEKALYANPILQVCMHKNHCDSLRFDMHASRHPDPRQIFLEYLREHQTPGGPPPAGSSNTLHRLREISKANPKNGQPDPLHKQIAAVAPARNMTHTSTDTAELLRAVTP